MNFHLYEAREFLVRLSQYYDVKNCPDAWGCLEFLSHLRVIPSFEYIVIRHSSEKRIFLNFVGFLLMN
jgi:hypothetical protein